MSQNTLYELRVSGESEIATVYSSDKAIAQLPTSVLFRSTVLQQAIREADTDDMICFELPESVLGAWLAGLDLLEIDWCLSHPQRGETYLHAPQGQLKLFECLKAADFLDDKEALTGLCKHAFKQLFVPFMSGNFQQIDVQVAKDLCELPSHLQQAVLASSRVLLGHGVRLLPEPLLEAAVHALHPSITTSSSISIPADDIDGKYGEACFRVVENATWLQEFCIEVDCDVPQHALQSIKRLRQLVSLTVRWRRKDADTSNSVKALSSALLSLTSLEYLKLSGTALIGGCEALAEALSQLTRLKSLDFNGCEMPDASIETLAPILPELPRLAFLGMAEQSGDHFYGVEKHSRRCTSLTELHLSGARFTSFALGDDEDRDFSRALMPCLQHLQISDVTWGNFLSEHLQKLTTVQVLKIVYFWEEYDDYYDDYFADPAALPLAECIGKLYLLRELDLHYQVGVDCVEHLESLREHVSKLRQLSILRLTGGCMLDEEGAAIADVASRCEGLQVLHIQETLHCNEPVPSDFLIRLLSISTLQELNINTPYRGIYADSPNFSTIAATALWSLHIESAQFDFEAAFFKALPALRHLDLHHSRISQYDAQKLAECMCVMPAMQSLSLCNVNIEGVGWMALASQLSNLVNLTKLDVRINAQQSFRDADILAEQLVSLTLLRQLCFPIKWLKSSGAEVLGPVIGTLTNLQELNVGREEQDVEVPKILAPYIVNLSALQMYVDLVDIFDTDSDVSCYF